MAEKHKSNLGRQCSTAVSFFSRLCRPSLWHAQVWSWKGSKIKPPPVSYFHSLFILSDKSQFSTSGVPESQATNWYLSVDHMVPVHNYSEGLKHAPPPSSWPICLTLNRAVVPKKVEDHCSRWHRYRPIWWKPELFKVTQTNLTDPFFKHVESGDSAPTAQVFQPFSSLVSPASSLPPHRDLRPPAHRSQNFNPP